MAKTKQKSAKKKTAKKKINKKKPQTTKKAKAPIEQKFSKQQMIENLTMFFAKYGARDPRSWAESQVEEGINQLHRFLFLRQAWSRIIDDTDARWIDIYVEGSKQRPNDPYAGIGHGLAKLLDKGADRQDIIDVVRGMQAEFLYQMCMNFEDPFVGDDELASFNINWALAEVRIDPETYDIQMTGNTIQALHESVLDTDPTGREMRPRSSVK